MVWMRQYSVAAEEQRERVVIMNLDTERLKTKIQLN